MPKINKRTEEFLRFFEDNFGVKFVEEDTGEEVVKDADSTNNGD